REKGAPLFAALFLDLIQRQVDWFTVGIRYAVRLQARSHPALPIRRLPPGHVGIINGPMGSNRRYPAVFPCCPDDNVPDGALVELLLLAHLAVNNVVVSNEVIEHAYSGVRPCGLAASSHRKEARRVPDLLTGKPERASSAELLPVHRRKDSGRKQFTQLLVLQ